MKSLFNMIKCLVRHDWRYEMALLEDVGHSAMSRPLTIGWKQCRRCAKSKVTMVLR